MPTLCVKRDFLFERIGKTFTDKEFEDVCFDFGLELDDITSERKMHMKERGVGDDATLSDDVVYKIDLPANRYDLCSCEGISIALRVFLGFMPTPRFQVLNKASPLYTMKVKRSVKNIRDYVVCSVLKNISFTSDTYKSFIETQEKLHATLARNRTLASVGTHDLDKLEGKHEFLYTALPREEISFVPLRETTVLNCAGNGLAEYYQNDRHIGKYVPLLKDFSRYPLIMDGAGKNVLSLPPIINSRYSAISQNTKNIFIECTAPDHNKASILVNQLVYGFSQYCEKPYTVEAVKVEYEDDPTPGNTKVVITPNFDPVEMAVSSQKAREHIGANVGDAKDCARLLERMLFGIKEIGEDNVTVSIPAFRNDIIGPYDLIEDIGISYGYDNIEYQECTTKGTVSQTAVSKVSHLIRQELAFSGYTELLTFSLCSHDDAFLYLQREDENVAVHIEKPKTVEFQVCRPSLLTGILKTLNANKSAPLPLRFFEVADVVLLDNEKNFPPILDTSMDKWYPPSGARNQRHLAAMTCGSANNSSFEQTLGLTEYIMCKFDIPQKDAESSCDVAEGDTYTLEPSNDDGAFFEGRAMSIFLHRQNQKVKIGGLGVIHPKTLKHFDILYPCSYVEINIQFLCKEI